MASEVDISNLALSHLGDDATVSSINPPEGSAQADHCATYYPVARDSLLEMHNWGFATKRVQGGLVTSESAKWLFAYTLPSDCIKVQKIVDPLSGNEDGSPFVIEVNSTDQSVVMTNVDDAVIIYTKRVTDTTKFTPNFMVALSWHLASFLAGPVIKGDQGAAEAKRCTQMMASFLSESRVQDAKGSRSIPTHNPAHLAAR